MPLPTDRSPTDVADTPTEHANDHNTVHAFVNDHPTDTLSVHGIVDTAALATHAEVATEIADHAATPHGGTHPDLAAHDTLGLATQSELDAHDHDADYEAAGAVVTHDADGAAHSGTYELAGTVATHEGAA